MEQKTEQIKKRIRCEGLSMELQLELIQAKRAAKGLPPWVPTSVQVGARRK
jgi:hypothetical protein